MLVTGRWTIWSPLPPPLRHLFARLRMTIPPPLPRLPVSKKFKAKMVSFVCLLIAISRGGSLRPTHEQPSKPFRTEPRTFGRRARQRHTKTSRIHETRRNAARGIQRCGTSVTNYTTTATTTQAPYVCARWSLTFPNELPWGDV